MGLLDKLFNRKEPSRNKDTGNAIQRYSKSFKHALDGLFYALKYEHNMIIILICFIIAVILGFIFKIKVFEWLFILIVSGCIATCEMINTSIEAIVDLITLKEHPLAKIAKDTASSASLILCLTALIGGLIIFLPKILVLFGG